MTLNCHGWLNIDKPIGISSAQVTACVKRILSKAACINVKVGHCGTLDVLASGVLPIAIGQSTKLSSYITNSSKKYTFTIQFGARTTTGDQEGKIVEKSLNLPSSESELFQVTKQFIGKYNQKIPSYSAAKFGGKPFYELARKGQEVPERHKEVEIYSLDLLSYDLDKATATYDVECSKGSYIRALAEDISISLQTLGFVLELRRTKVLSLVASKAVSFENLRGSYEQALVNIKNNLLEVESLIKDIPSKSISLSQAQNVLQGKQLYLELPNLNLLWLRYQKRIVSIGKIEEGQYRIFCNFNLIDIK